MHGPYAAQIKIRPAGRSAEAEILLEESEVVEGDRIAARFYQGAGIGTVEGFSRAAVFTAGLLLSADDEGEVDVIGLIAGKPHGVRHYRVRRDSAGRLVSDLGSRFNERVFVGA